MAKLARKHSLPSSRILVCHDDLDLDLGKMKLKLGGSAGGHRGVLSCEQSLACKDFWRLRIGIGRPARKEDVPDYVLEPFAAKECAELPTASRTTRPHTCTCSCADLERFRPQRM